MMVGVRKSGREKELALPKVMVEGAAVTYEERGKGDPVILLHGWNGSRKQWTLNLKELATRYRAIAPDLPGYGESEENGAFPYTREGMASFLEAFRRALRLQAIHLLGHSMGGCIAVHYAAANPDKVRKLVLVSTPTHSASLGLGGILPGRELFLRATYRYRNEAMLKWMFYRALYQPEYQDLDFVRSCVRASALTSRKALSESTRIARGMNLDRELGSITCPTLIVFGDKDRVVNPREAERQRRLLQRPYKAMVTSCGHCPHYERPDLFNQLVLEFLQSQDAA
jgi:pimeloyl-ACP methyl ester carboxylesterase